MTATPDASVSSLAPTLIKERGASLEEGSLATVVQSEPTGSLPITRVTSDGSTRRTTVLPRLSLEGGAPRLSISPQIRFEERGVLGRGGVGEVLLARDHDIERDVAMKRLLPDFEGTSVVARFADEVRTLGRLDHPNIVPVHDVGADAEGRIYYLMKYVEGETLEAVIEKLSAGDVEYHQRYPFERRIEVFLGILNAVQYAHAKGYLHRDLKPANVMVGLFGEVVVMDWGLARTMGDTAPEVAVDAPATDVSPRHRTLVGTVLGTPAYMSPEQSLGEVDTMDERSDVYSLGVILHELLKLRHYLADKKTVTETLVAVQTVEVNDASLAKHPAQPPVPAEYVWLIRHATSKNRDDRFRSVKAMIHRIELIREGKMPVECPVTFLRRMNCEMAHGMNRSASAALLGFTVFVGLALVGAVSVVYSLVFRA